MYIIYTCLYRYTRYVHVYIYRLVCTRIITMYMYIVTHVCTGIVAMYMYLLEVYEGNADACPSFACRYNTS